MTSTHTRVIVTGGHGSLASALKPYFPYAEYPGKAELDVTNPHVVHRYFSLRSVDLVIHTAAEIAYDAPLGKLLAVNMGGTANVTHEAAKQGARMVYLSTDYVYPGTAGNYREDADTAPIGNYAKSKYAGECAALNYVHTLAIRTSFYTSLNWQSAATDAFTSKMPIAEVAGLIAGLATSDATGVVNVGGPRRSLFEIVVETNPRVQAINRVNAHLRLPYELPRDVSMDCTRMRRILG